MESQESKNRKRKGLIVTISVHAVVLVLFCLFGFEIIDPKPGGMEIEWAVEGIEDAGGENNQENTSEETSSENNTPKETSASSSSASQDEELLTSETSDVAVKSTPVKDKVKKTPKDTKVKTTQDSDAKTEETKEAKRSSLFDDLEAAHAANKGKLNKGGEGSGKNIGTEGKVNSGGTDKSGTGGGNGDPWVIAGRKPVKIDKKRNDCNETGKVEVYIKINRQGQVISAVDRGGTTQNKCLINKALEQARGIRYAESSTFNEGTITIDLGL